MFLKTKIFTLFLIIFLFFLFFYFGFDKYLNLEFFISKKQEFDSLYKSRPVVFVLGFFLFYVFCATLSIPGAPLLTLIAGFLFGFFVGTVVVSLGSTLGAVFSFLISRFLLKDFIQKRFRSRLKKINQGIKKDGAFYLFSLRLIPIFPYLLVNIFMGVSPLSIRSFVIASFLGMLPGSLVYANVGNRLSDIKSLAEVFSPSILLSFVLLAFLPWIIKGFMRLFTGKRSVRTK